MISDKQDRILLGLGGCCEGSDCLVANLAAV